MLSEVPRLAEALPPNTMAVLANIPRASEWRQQEFDKRTYTMRAPRVTISHTGSRKLRRMRVVGM